MKTLLTISCLALLAACARDEPLQADANGEARLSAALRDYSSAGPAVSCVSTRNLGGNRSAGEGAIIFDGGRHDRLWVNRPPAGCPDLSFGRALAVRTTTTKLCRGDIADVFDPVSGFHFGGCALGDFEPYRRNR
jgi:hypothetical protein